MGSSYYGPNSDCYHCSGCGTYRACDDCSASCCQNNMSDHRELRRYEDRWENRFVLNEVIINTDYKSGEECFEVKFKEKIPIESLSQISKFTVERRSDKF